MKNRRFIKLLIFMISIAFLAAAVEVAAQRPTLKRKPAAKRPVATRPAPALYSVDAGTVFRVRMDRTITSKSAKAGETFTVTVTEPVYSSNGVVVVPTGSKLLARIDSVKPAAKGGKVGEIDARFVELRLPNGRRRAINGSLTDLDAGKTESDDEGAAKGDKMKNRKVVFIGGGAAGGAILGAIVGGGKATAIGAIAGAGAGILGERLMKGAEAEVKSGTEFGVYLNQRIALPRFAETTID